MTVQHIKYEVLNVFKILNGKVDLTAQGIYSFLYISFHAPSHSQLKLFYFYLYTF